MSISVHMFKYIINIRHSVLMKNAMFFIVQKLLSHLMGNTQEQVSESICLSLSTKENDESTTITKHTDH